MGAILEIADLKQLARRRVPKMFFDYADSGSWSETTYRANSEDFRQIKLRQRVAVDISERSLKTALLGQETAMPVALAPVGLTGMQHADGEILAARAAADFGVPFSMSMFSICSIETVAQATKRPFWFQLYMMRDRGFVGDIIDRAKAAGCSALVATVDLQMLGQRHKDLRNRLSAPPRLTPKHIWQVVTRPAWAFEMLRCKNRTFGNVVGHAKGVSDLSSLSAWTAEQLDLSLSWKDIEWVKQRWGGPMIVKGILDVRDGQSAIDCGADAISVSNHGGRQLDGAPSSISVLPEIVDALGSKVEIHMDGGVRSGQDVLKALCLGAKGVHIGRAYIFGLGAMGQAGVKHALEIIAKELDMTMALCGERNVTELSELNLYFGTRPGRTAGVLAALGEEYA